jgi:4-hydroxybenzoate polyprenyltransferase
MGTRFNAFLQLIRWPNLIMTVIGLYSHWYWLIYTSKLGPASFIQKSLIDSLFIALSLVLLMAAGYIINDLFDLKSDLINKPNKVFIPEPFSIRQAKRIYLILNGLSALIAIFLSIRYGLNSLIILLPIIIYALYWYSRLWQHMALVGNGLIAGLCATVLLIPYLVESHFNDISITLPHFVFCAGIALCLTLLRELTKDQEDMPGDRARKAETFPIRWGLRRSNNLAIGISGFTLIGLIVALWSFDFSWMVRICLLLFIGVPIAVLIPIHYRAEQKNYAFLSACYKGIMGAGMLVLPWACSTLHG